MTSLRLAFSRGQSTGDRFGELADGPQALVHALRQVLQARRSSQAPPDIRVRQGRQFLLHLLSASLQAQGPDEEARQDEASDEGLQVREPDVKRDNCDQGGDARSRWRTVE